MKKKRILATLLTGIIVSLAILSLTGCNLILKPGGGSRVVATYSSQYTDEEHLERITQRTKEYLQYAIDEGSIVNYKVELIYAFYTRKPGLFMVEWEFAGEIEASYNNPYYDSNDSTSLKEISYKSKYAHMIGMISCDEYWFMRGKGGRQGGYSGFIVGRNPYDALGYGDYKKYYGDLQHAVEIDGKLFRIYGGGIEGNPPLEYETSEKALAQYFLTEKDEKNINTRTENIGRKYLK